ncbi:ABC1 kinase family protein [Spirillospora sp. NPDC050679]
MSARRLLDVTRVLTRLATEEGARLTGRRGRHATPSETRRQRARSMRLALERLGPFYIKVGQMLSTRPDLVSAETMAEFAQLHDKVSPAPFEVFEPVLAEEWGPAWRDRFAKVADGQPLGSASLAQVYEVILPDGTSGVLKVQRPDIRALVLDDMAMARRAVRLVARRARDLNAVIDLEATLNVVFEAMEAELDFTVEAANMDRARELVADFEYLDVPEVIAASPRAMVQALAPGRSIREVDPAALTERERLGIGRDLLAFAYRGYLVDRFFHADLHPGNIFVAPGHRASLIDWGMVGRLDRRMSMTLVAVLLAVAHNDGTGVARAWLELGKATPWADVPAFCGDVAVLVPKVTTASLDELDFGLTLTTMIKYAAHRGIQTSPVIALLGKSFANLEGSVRHLAPELKVTEIFEEEVRDILFRLVGQACSEIAAARTTVDLLIGAALVPEQLRGLLRDASNRELTLRLGHLRAKGAPDPTTSLALRQKPTSAIVLAAAGVLLWWTRRSRVVHVRLSPRYLDGTGRPDGPAG